MASSKSSNGQLLSPPSPTPHQPMPAAFEGPSHSMLLSPLSHANAPHSQNHSQTHPHHPHSDRHPPPPHGSYLPKPPTPTQQPYRRVPPPTLPSPIPPSAPPPPTLTATVPSSTTTAAAVIPSSSSPTAARVRELEEELNRYRSLPQHIDQIRAILGRWDRFESEWLEMERRGGDLRRDVGAAVIALERAMGGGLLDRKSTTAPNESYRSHRPPGPRPPTNPGFGTQSQPPHERVPYSPRSQHNNHGPPAPLPPPPPPAPTPANAFTGYPPQTSSLASSSSSSSSHPQHHAASGPSSHVIPGVAGSGTTAAPLPPGSSSLSTFPVAANTNRSKRVRGASPGPPPGSGAYYGPSEANGHGQGHGIKRQRVNHEGQYRASSAPYEGGGGERERDRDRDTVMAEYPVSRREGDDYHPSAVYRRRYDAMEGVSTEGGCGVDDDLLDLAEGRRERERERERGRDKERDGEEKDLDDMILEVAGEAGSGPGVGGGPGRGDKQQRYPHEYHDAPSSSFNAQPQQHGHHGHGLSSRGHGREEGSYAPPPPGRRKHSGSVSHAQPPPVGPSHHNPYQSSHQHSHSLGHLNPTLSPPHASSSANPYPPGRSLVFRNTDAAGMESTSSHQRGGSNISFQYSTSTSSPPSTTNNHNNPTQIAQFLPPTSGPPQTKKPYSVGQQKPTAGAVNANANAGSNGPAVYPSTPTQTSTAPANGAVPVNNPNGGGGSNNGFIGNGVGGVRGPGPGPPPGQQLRKCKTCGEPGRYKDGRCVEKWGPGPEGPGTVCDRCRKKMKRVERRSGMEAAAMAQAQQKVRHLPHEESSSSYQIQQQQQPHGGRSAAATGVDAGYSSAHPQHSMSSGLLAAERRPYSDHDDRDPHDAPRSQDYGHSSHSQSQTQTLSSGQTQTQSQSDSRRSEDERDGSWSAYNAYSHPRPYPDSPVRPRESLNGADEHPTTNAHSQEGDRHPAEVQREKDDKVAAAAAPPITAAPITHGSVANNTQTTARPDRDGDGDTEMDELRDELYAAADAALASHRKTSSVSSIGSADANASASANANANGATNADADPNANANVKTSDDVKVEDA